MNRIDLQLFALNTKKSVVDYLNSQGQDSSMAARKEIAKSLGISNYSGTYEQNVQMLNALQSGSQTATPKASTPSVNTMSANVAGSAQTSINGVDQATIDKMNSTYQKSDAVNNADAEAKQYLDKVKDLANVTDIIDQSTWDAINNPFSASTAYNEAMNYTNQLLQQLSSGKTSYSDQIDALIGEIQNRDKFEYDVDSDMLFQQYLTSAMNSGKAAMMDTMGQASALTGGYGSTYATSAANQQYNAYIQDAYNNLPEYYQMALEAYQMEGEEMYNQLSMLNQADATEYQRLYDAWNANFSNAQSMYEKEYGAWQDSVNNAYNSANLQLNEYGQLFDQTYNAYTAVQNNANNLYAQEYQNWADQVNNAFNFAGLANSDYWSTQNFIEDQRQFNENLAWNKESFDQEMDYKYSALAQDQAQHEASLKQNNDQFIKKQAQDNAQFYASQANKRTSDVGMGNGNLSNNMSFSTTEINGIKSAYRDAGGGMAGYEAVDSYLKGIGKYQETEEFQGLIDSYINSADAQDGLPAWYQTWNLTDDTQNRNNPFVPGNEDYNDEYTNLNGQKMTYKELKNALKNSGLSDEEVEAFLNELQGKSIR